MKTPYIILKNIDYAFLDKKYKFEEYREKNKNLNYDNNNVNTTKHTKLYDLKHNNVSFSFIDEAKSDHYCLLTMTDLTTREKLPKQTNLHCFFCHHQFSTIPLGCPIDFKSTKVYKNYYSEITKSYYILQETVSKQEDNDKQNTSYFQNETQILNYYVTDGVFCSFNCCKAFIQMNSKNPLYKQSENLLNKIYMNLFQIKDSFEIQPAPDWRLLESYGGPLSIDSFRKNFYKVEYIDREENSMVLPTCRTIGHIYEKKIKL